MFTLLLWNTALAATVDGGVQIGLFDAGLEFIEDRYSEEVFTIEPTEVAGENVSCYNRVGIANFNATIPIQSIDLSMGDDHLVINVYFGSIQGSDMVIFGEDEDTFDLCPAFDSWDFNSFRLDNARVLVEVIPELTESGFDVQISGSPSVSGDLTTDIDWVPDTIINNFVEDAIFEQIEQMMLERVPDIASTVLQPSLFAGQVGDIGLGVELTDIHADRKALLVGLDVEAEWLGEGCPISGVAREPIGLSPTIDFDNGDGAGIGIGITELQINRLFFGAWEGGLLCFDEGPLSRFKDVIEEAIEPTVENGEISIVFPHNPVFYLEENQASLSLDNVVLAMNGDVNGTNTELLQLEVNLLLGAELRVEHEISSFVFTLTHVDLSVLDFQSNGVIKNSAAVADNLIQLLEGWAVDTLVNRIEDVPIYGNLFHIADIYMRVTDVAIQDGMVVIMGSLYNSDDPDVDNEAPDTTASIESATNVHINVSWDAEDDNNGPLAYSWRVDQGEWSAWTGEMSGKIPTPSMGLHEIQVRARDDWLNIDESPYTLLFEVTPDPKDDKKGCQCASSGNGWSGLWWMILLSVVGTRRRRE